MRPLLVLAVVAFSALVLTASAPSAPWPATYRIDHVTDGDTVVLRSGQKIRLVQIDTPEVYFGTECYGPQASATTKRLLPVGTRVRLTAEPATDRVDQYGRLLRYVVRASDGVNVNLRLVACWSRCAVLLQGSERQVREPAGGSCEACEVEAPRSVGQVSAYAV
jgi:endonuclease YncB( thermonuclease family)